MALFVGESEAFAAQLLLDDAVLLDEVVDHLRLLPVDAAGERGEEQLKWEEVGHHA